MPKYSVELPIVGWALVEVEADDERAAADAALGGEITFDDIQEWDAVRRVTQGHICYAPRNSIEVTEIESDED